MTFDALPSPVRWFALVFLPLAGVAMLSGFAAAWRGLPPEAGAGVLLSLGVPFALALGTLAWVGRLILRPMTYRVGDGVLEVPAHFRPVRVRLDGARVSRGPMGFAWRLAGSAMPGFYLGAFRAGGRSFHAAATDRARGVWVEGDRRVFVTPAEPEAFVAALLARGAREE